MSSNFVTNDILFDIRVIFFINALLNIINNYTTVEHKIQNLEI